jgi:hypothetical protein
MSQSRSAVAFFLFCGEVVDAHFINPIGR